jgi:hypothetical protein
MQPEQAEHAGRSRRKLLVGPREYVPHVHGGLAAVQRIEPPAGVAQLCREHGERKPWPGRRAGGDDAERQRQPGACSRQLAGSARLGGQLRGTQPAGQELVSLRVGEGIEGNGVGAFGSSKRRELAAAGHDDQAVSAGQQ